MSDRPKLLFLIPHLGGGGAEQVTRLLVQNLDPKRYELHLGLVTGTSAGLPPMPAGASIHALGASRVRTGTRKILGLVRRLKPDLIVSGMAHLNFVVLALRPLFPRRTRVLLRQNATVSAALGFGALPWYTGSLYRLLYPRADCVICQTNAMARDLAALLGSGSRTIHVPASLAASARITVVPNPVDVDRIRAEVGESNSLWEGPGPHLLAVGRLSLEKGHDLLLRAFFQLRQHFPLADLTIVGKGPEMANLRSLAIELGLSPAVRFTGPVDSPAAFFSGATAFVLSSRHEGLPNALLEAAAAGLPIVALPSSQGVAELLAGQPGVWIANTISSEALSGTLITALQQLQTGQRFSHAFIDQFRLERSLSAYQRLIDSELTGSHAGRPL
jgi:glycosyltransferase involved in cell wall biosynthesis